MEDEMLYLESLPNYCFERLVRLVGDVEGFDATQLRQDVLAAARISTAYLWLNCFRIVMLPPFDLPQGCVRTNSEQLMKRDRSTITDRVTKQIYDMLHLGENIETIFRTLKLVFGYARNDERC